MLTNLDKKCGDLVRYKSLGKEFKQQHFTRTWALHTSLFAERFDGAPTRRGGFNMDTIWEEVPEVNDPKWNFSTKFFVSQDRRFCKVVTEGVYNGQPIKLERVYSNNEES